MKKFISLVLTLVCLLAFVGCGNKPAEPINTVEGNIKTYNEMSDGTWQFEGHTYLYRLEISGRMPNAVKDTTYVFLSNVKDISFEKAMMASGLSSNTEAYFSLEEAVLVEIN